MAYSVTSWFIEQLALENPPIVRKFTIAGSDYTDHVLRWPQVKSQWNEFRPNNVTLSLANEDGALSFFQRAKVNVRSDCEISFGFTHPSSGDEMLSILTGKVADVTFSKGAVDLRIVDKVQQLSDRIVGTSAAAAVFSSSIMLPSDVVWTLCTCYGGLSSIQSTSNPDIDYASWLAWADVLSGDNLTVGASFQGQKVTECIRKILENTQSSGFVANNKLVFTRWSGPSPNVVSLNSNEIKDLSVSVKADNVVNKQWVEYDFNLSTKTWNASISAVNSASVGSYGLREQVIKDESFWYKNSTGALNLAERALSVTRTPYDQLTVQTVLKPAWLTVGDTVYAVDPELNLADSWRIMSQSVDLESGQITLELDASQQALSGVTWTSRTIADSGDLRCVIHNGSQFIAGGILCLFHSDDTVVWSGVAVANSFRISNMCFNGSLYCATGGTLAWYASNLSSWTPVTVPVSYGGLGGVIWDGDQFITVCAMNGVGSLNAGSVLVSANAQSWSVVYEEVGSQGWPLQITRNDSLYCVAGAISSETSPAYAYMLRGSDIRSLSRVTVNSVETPVSGMTWANELSQFCLVGQVSGSPAVYTSSDALSWSRKTVPTNTRNANAVTWNGRLYVVVGNAIPKNISAGSHTLIMTSPDGEEWTQRIFTTSLANEIDLKSVVWGESKFCAVGAYNINHVLTSY